MDDQQALACDLPAASSRSSAPAVQGRGAAEPPPALDLTSDEDLGIGLMNLISIEEHLFFTASKTGNPLYYTHLLEIREMRKELLKKIVVSYEGEVWCISKHLLAASMRLMEVGTKELKMQGVTAAQPYFAKSYRLFRMFWEVVLQQPGHSAPVAQSAAPEKIAVMIYFEPGCRHCAALDTFLASNHLEDTFNITRTDVSTDPVNRAAIAQVQKDCLKQDGPWQVPVVVHDGQCAMGEEDAIRLFKSLMWDGVKALHHTTTAMVQQGNLPPHVEGHLVNYSKAVDAALNCCKE